MGSLNNVQILLISAWAFWGIIDSLSWNIGMNNCILACLFTGIVVGNPTFGLVVGGTLQLTQLGMGTYGGASIPNITSSGMITTALGVTSGSTGLDDAVALAASVGVTLGALFTQLDILARFSNTFFQHMADKYVVNGNEKGIRLMNTLGIIPWGLSRMLPVFVLLLIGEGAINTLIGFFPEKLMLGFQKAGGLLPVVGFAILLRYLPVLKAPQYIILGFVLSAYLGMPALGYALIGLVAALLVFQSSTKAAPAAAATSVGGDDYED